jgi:hypothetical protein
LGVLVPTEADLRLRGLPPKVPFATDIAVDAVAPEWLDHVASGGASDTLR